MPHRREVYPLGRLPAAVPKQLRDHRIGVTICSTKFVALLGCQPETPIMRVHEHTQPAQSETMAQRVRVARAILQALRLAASVRNLENFLPRRVRHRKARFRQPDHRRLKAIFAFDKHPAPLIGVQTVKRHHLIVALQIPVVHPTVLRDRHLNHDSRHMGVPALLLRPPNRFRPTPLPVCSDRGQRLERYPVVPPLPLSNSFSKASGRVARGLGTGQFPDQ